MASNLVASFQTGAAQARNLPATAAFLLYVLVVLAMFWCKLLVSLLAGLVLADVQTCTNDSCDAELASDFAAAVGTEGPEESLELLQVKQVSCLQFTT